VPNKNPLNISSGKGNPMPLRTRRTKIPEYWKWFVNVVISNTIYFKQDMLMDKIN